MPDRPLRAFIYVRISRDRVGAGIGVERQQRECSELAERLGLNVVQVFIDNDKSAYNGKPRPDYIRMMAALQVNEADVVLAWHTDRLHRSPTELNAYIEVCEPRNIPTHTVKAGKIDLSTPGGRMQARIYADIARYEVEHMVERITSAKSDAARKGQWPGGGRPYGYEPDGKTIRESEATVIRKIVERIIAGETLMSVVRSLNDQGISTVTGKKWCVGNLKRTITKKRYIGVREHVPEHGGPRSEYPAEWPGIISTEDYELMMARLNASAQPWEHGPIRGRTYLLSGIAVCGSCGAPMYGQRRGSDANNQRRYRCKPTDNHGIKVGCGKVFRQSEALDAFVTAAVLHRFDSPQVARALAQDNNADRAQNLAQELLKLKLRRKELARRLALADKDEEQDYAEMLDAVRQAMHLAQRELNELQRSSTAHLLPPAGTLRQAWEAGSIEWRRSVIQLIVKEVRVLPGHPRSTFWEGHRFDPEAIVIQWIA